MKMKKYMYFVIAIFVCLITTCIVIGCSKKDEELISPDNPTKITIWTYYTDENLKAFEKLVEEYNETEGKILGIHVDSVSFNTILELEENVIAASEDDNKLPNIFLSYADVAYRLDKMGLIEDISTRFTKKDIELYIESFIDEGSFQNDGEIKIFPTAKSTELLFINKTDWDLFSNATGVNQNSLTTIEGIIEVAEQYYNWTDSLTEEEGDGKAFFGYDALDNYFVIGAQQLGVEMFINSEGDEEINFEKQTVRKLWDCYYVPCIKGYFSSSTEFSSNEVMKGNVIAYVGSSAGASYFPDVVQKSETESYDIEMTVLESPYFEEGENYKVQQGAGMAVTKASEQEVYASARFLKWFTEPENNIVFSVNSGYLPVTKEGNNIDKILSSEIDEIDDEIKQVITLGVQVMNEHKLYVPSEFEGGSKARDILKNSLKETATADRESIKQGTPIDGFLSDEYFDVWYEKTLEQLENCIE